MYLNFAIGVSSHASNAFVYFQFITKGGLKHLLNIFKGESLQAKGEEAWSQVNYIKKA